MSLDEIVPKQPKGAPSAVPEEDVNEGERAAAVEPVARAQAARVVMAHDALAAAPSVGVSPETIDAEFAAQGPAATPEGSPPKPPEAPGFVDQVLTVFDASQANGKNTFMASLDAVLFAVTTGGSAIWNWAKELFNNLFGKKKTESEETASSEGQTTAGPEVQAADPSKVESLLAEAKNQLKEAFTKNPPWLDFAKEASEEYGISVATILAIARFESGGFDPNAKNPKSSAEGLGQFMPETWAQFLAENSEFGEVSPTDPEAALFAIAWYCKTNAEACGIDLNSPTAAKELYLAHHEGPGAYKKLKAFQQGKLGDEAPEAPGTYKGHSFPDFGVSKVDTYDAYVTLVTRMADRVQAIAEEYTAFLPTLAVPKV